MCRISSPNIQEFHVTGIDPSRQIVLSITGDPCNVRRAGFFGGRELSPSQCSIDVTELWDVPPGGAFKRSVLIHKEFAISFRHHINNFHIQYVSLKAHWLSRRLSRAFNRKTLSTNRLTAADVSLCKAHGLLLCNEPSVCAPLQYKKGLSLSQNQTTTLTGFKKTSKNI